MHGFALCAPLFRFGGAACNAKENCGGSGGDNSFLRVFMCKLLISKGCWKIKDLGFFLRLADRKTVFHAQAQQRQIRHACNQFYALDDVKHAVKLSCGGAAV